jgi:hypothetical protein
VLNDYDRAYTTAHREVTLYPQPARRNRRDDVIGDAVGDLLVERSLVAK